MPQIVLFDEGKERILDWKTTEFVAAGIKMRLFKNNHTVVRGDTIAAYTTATFSGYADKTIGAWGAAALVGAGPQARAEAGLQTWTPSDALAGCDVYGYIVFDPADNTVLWGENDPNAPVRVGDDLRPYSVLPRLTEDTAP